MKITALYYKVTAEVLLLIPVIFLLVLGAGEMISGDMSGVQHFVEVTPFLVMAFLGWKYPKIIGSILSMTAILLAVSYFLFLSDLNPLIRAISCLILFLPPMIAGMLFFTSKLEDSKKEKGLYASTSG